MMIDNGDYDDYYDDEDNGNKTCAHYLVSPSLLTTLVTRS